MKGKTIVVIGGLSGIGRAVAERAAREGARVIAAGRRAAPADWSPQIEIAKLDVRDEGAVEKLFTSLGAIDHLVTTAGPVIGATPLAGLDLDALKQAFDIKLFGQIRAVKHAARVIAKDGSIVLTSGLLSRKATPGTLVKATMNAAIESMTRTLAKELAPVRVNAVCPGMIETEMWGPMSDEERKAMAAKVGTGIPVGRVGQSDEVADAYMLLMRNGFMNGTTVDVDGGGLL
ncbi:SDR family oxidoreductase [Pararobbsia alpina]|uniref:3-oxoacyl-[acyl-carrier-protein] reductase FabG n=1 Tax=Pararobbsia alpina TaxID=621374 RepID=A0A6S7BI75_9BURK|nr:SDR family oxidoreductase [Pararobbsia alpina]CAB3792092.1 3-oxoacyl-[acyl-carrier-protein] reductase FabG [Pararobbsia alpina]